MLIKWRSMATPILLLLVLLAATSVALAQSTSLTGQVKDPQGAIVPGSSVTVTDQTGASRTAVTDDEGRFQFVQLLPGTYEVRVEQDGFKTKVLSDVRLLVDTPATLTVDLELGDISEIVTVSSQMVELLNTVDASIGNAFNEEQINDLPLNARNVAQLLSLQPGVDQAGNVVGARSDQSNLTLDGIAVNDEQEGTAFTPVLRVTPDSIQEFRVTVSNPGASQGRSSGAQVSLVTRSGSNDWHGSLYEFHRNTVTTANDFFNNRVEGDPDLDGEPGIGRPALIRNLFGGSLGGPIVSDKAFFFFNYEGRRDRSQSTALRVVPLAHVGQGILRIRREGGGFIELGPNEFDQIYPQIGGQNPAAAAVLADAASRFPANDDGSGDQVNTGGFRFNAPTPLNQNTYTGKLDFNLTDNMQLFIRGNYQWDNQGFVGQFPGEPAPTLWSHPIGSVVGHTWNISPSLTNTVRYGFTRQAFSSQGDSGENAISFRFLFSPRAFSRTLNRTTPVHNITNDTAWITGNHTVQFGTNIRIIRNQRDSFTNAFDSAITNPSFYAQSGAVVETPIRDFLDANPQLGAAAGGSQDEIRNTATALIGRFSQFSARFTFGADGSLLTAGSPAAREFATEEYEFYIEDSWQVTPGLTLNLGLRWGVNTPVNESSGFQVAPTVPLGDFFESRQAAAAQGTAFNDSIVIDTSGPFYGKPGFYPTDKNNFSPRISAAWSPRFENGFLSALFGSDGKSVFRGGFSTLYDRIGSRLAVSFDNANTLGFVSRQTIAANTHDVTGNPGPLFTAFGQDVRGLPGIILPSDLTFPLIKPADEAQRIESSLDSALTTPINYNWNFSIGREFSNGLFIEVGYLGRYADNLLATRDVMALNNIVDPASGMDWYTAGTLLQQARVADTPLNQIAPIPFFENLFPNLGSSGLFWTDPSLTPTQNVFNFVARDGIDILDMTFLQSELDDVGIFPNMFFHPQFAALSTFSTVASSEYHAMTVTVRERFRDSLTMDLNWTWAKSIDNASGLQNSNFFGTAFILNPLRPDDNRSISDFDTQHIINANWLWDLPFGRGRTFGSGAGGLTNALVGGWKLSGIFRWNSGLALTAPFENSRWATNWNVQSNAVRIRDPQLDPTKSGAVPNAFGNVQAAYNSFRDAFAGETGDRNVFRQDGFFQIDFGLHKAFTMPFNENHKVVFRWEVFNATNTQRLDAPNFTRTGFATNPDPQDGTPPSSFGNITTIQGNPRVMQFALRYEF